MTGAVKEAAGSQLRVAYVGIVLVALWIGSLLLTPTAQRYGTGIDRWANPIVSEFRSENWRLMPETGFWRANVTGIREETTCRFDKDYIVNALVQLPDKDDVPFEVLVTFPDDTTPGSTRPAGFQSFGVWQFHSADIVPSSVIFVNLRHQCTVEPEGTTYARISTVGPFTVR